MTIRNLPLDENPREKLFQKGPDSLSDAELLAIFFRTGVKGKSAIDLARDLLHQFGDLRAVLKLSADQFYQIKGLGLAKFAQLQASLELGRRNLKQRLQSKTVLADSLNTRNYLAACLQDYPHEVFACLFLDTQHRVICFEELFTGTVDSTMVYIRQLIKRCLFHNTAAVILAHNHPSGIAEPSKEDVYITKQIKQCLRLMDIRVLDHIVVGDGITVSFSERGLL